jgi:hypothetical protein
MKLPPLGLSAPTLCPRCDAPASLADMCLQCALQLRQCGNCHGVAGPFDRYCGFCGFELLRGARRSPVWRLWVLIALIPLAAGLSYGAWVARLPAAVTHTVGAAVRPAPTPDLHAYQSQSLRIAYAIPKDWSAIDYTRSSDAGRSMPYVVVAKAAGDQQPAVQAKGDMVEARPQSALVALGRPSIDRSLVADATAPAGVLTSEVAPLAVAPPSGTKVEVTRPVRPLTVGGRPAASVVLKLTRDGVSYYLQRTLIYAPSGGAQPMIRVDALVPASAWESGDRTPVDTLINSVHSA